MKGKQTSVLREGLFEEVIQAKTVRRKRSRPCELWEEEHASQRTMGVKVLMLNKFSLSEEQKAKRLEELCGSY